MEHINPKARFKQRFEHFEKAFFNLYELKTSHTYTQDNLNQNVCFILEEFLPLVENLHKTLRDKLCNMD